MRMERFNPPSVRRRPPERQDEIVEYFRRRILDGQLRPGDRLPDRLAVKELFGVSYLTVQRAFDRLIGSGFVESIQSKGTFVSARQPHLRRFALAIPQKKASNESWRRFYAALERAAAQLSTPEMAIDVYDGVDPRLGFDGYARLVRDVEHKSVAGILFPSNPWHLEGTPILAAGLPMAVLSASEEKGYPGVKLGGMSNFLDKAVVRLAGSGCRRVACLSSIGYDACEVGEQLRRKLGSREIPFERKWLQAGSIGASEWNRSLTRLLLDGPPDAAPDGLILLDDNIAWDVFSEIAEMGLPIPDGLRIVSHCNFPFEGRPPFPVDFLGYDAVELIEKGIRAAQSGSSSAKYQTVAAKFMDDVPAEK